MSELCINKTIFYERILASYSNPNEAVLTTQKRLALQDALNCEDNNRALKALNEYLSLFKNMLDYISSNRSNIVLKEQPQFDWSWENESWMSTCWQWEHIMIYASLYKLNLHNGMDQMKNQNWKDASKHFSDACRYSKTIVEKILPLWSWKTDHTIHLTFKDYWHSKLYYSNALKNLCTLQFAYMGNGISDNNALKLLNRIENDSNKSIVKWAAVLNVSLMNWARVGKAIIQARVYSENDEYGKAIGLIDNWESSFTKLKDSDKLNIVMECFVTQLQLILDLRNDWSTSNNNIHYKPIEVPDLVVVQEKTDILNSIKSF
jgi:hypothetical protein